MSSDIDVQEPDGRQAISVPLRALWLLAQLPAEVQVLSVLPPMINEEWRDNPGKLLFLKIQHPKCFRSNPGNHLTCERIEDFIARVRPPEPC